MTDNCVRGARQRKSGGRFLEILMYWVFSLCPILNNVTVGVFSLSTILMTVLGLVYILRRRKKLLSDKILNVLIIVVIFQSLIIILLRPDDQYTFNTALNDVLLYFQIVVFGAVIGRGFDNGFWKVLKVSAVIFMIGILYQSVLIYVLGQGATPLFKGNVLSDSISFRPLSFFSEPQAYATYMAAVLLIALYKNKLLFSVLIAFTIFLSTSSLGIVVVALSFIIFIIGNNRLTKKRRILYAILIIAVCAFVFSFFSQITEFVFGKIQNIDIMNDDRLSKGFLIISKMNFFDILTGIGVSNSAYIIQLPLYFAKQAAYLTSFTGVLISYGVLAAMVFYVMLIKHAIKRDSELRAIGILIIALTFMQTIFFNYWFFHWYVLYYAVEINQKEKVRMVDLEHELSFTAKSKKV